MAITNPTKYVSVQRLQRFETKLAAKYQTQAITAITGLNAETVEAALAELLGKIQAIPSAIIPKGSRTFSQLAPSTDLAAGCLGFMWNISDAFTTTADFAEGAGKSIPAGANIYVANVGTAAVPSYKYDIFQGMYDLSGYALKSEMSITDGTGTDADKTTIQLKSGLSKQVLIAHQDISGKADKDTDAVEGNFAAFDANGNPVDSGHKHSDYLTSHQDISGKADKDTDAVEGNIAKFDANGNPVDSGKSASDFTYTGGDGIDVDNSNVISLDITAGNGLSINGTSKKLEMAAVSASTSGSGGSNGAMLATDKEKLDGLLECSDNDIDSIFA